MSEEFHRIYWSKEFDWKSYAKLYYDYCKTKENYYVQSARYLSTARKLSNSSVVVDLGCGTGILTRLLLRKYPKIKIIAIDVSEESLCYYKKDFNLNIKSGQIQVFCGNGEELNKFIKEKVDCIFIASALWDMDLITLFKSIPLVLKDDGVVITNLPSVTYGHNEGFIYELEEFFKKEAKIEKLYRRIEPQTLNKLLSKNGLYLEKRKKYEFLLSKENIAYFFQVLKYRYPFIFFFDEVPMEKRFEICSRTFDKMLNQISSEGIKETGYVLSIKKS